MMRWLLPLLSLLFASSAQAQITCPAPVGPGRVVGDANMTLSNSFSYYETGAQITAPRTWTLPPASTVNKYCMIIFSDQFGGITAQNTVTIAAGASPSSGVQDTINGGPSIPMASKNSVVMLQSDGSSKWVVAIGISSFAAMSINGGQLGSGTVLGVGSSINGGYVPNSVVPTTAIISATGAVNGFVGQVDNTVPYATSPFLAVGTTGYGKVPSGTASVSFGLYGLGEIFNSLGAVVAGEVTARNFGGSNANTGVPPPLGSPSSNLVADGFHITCGAQAVGEKDCSTGLFVSNENAGSSVTDPSFANGIIVNGYRNFGLYVASGYPTGNQVTAELDNNGNSFNLELKTTGAMTAGNAVLVVVDNLAATHAAIFQNGNASFNNLLLTQPAGIFFGSDEVVLSTGSGLMGVGTGASLTLITIGNTSNSVINLAPKNGGAAAKYVCTDSSNNMVIQAGAC